MPELLVRRDDLASCELVETEPPAAGDLADGEARLRVERFALTSNNITYGATGDVLGYWKLFPAREGWGRIPAWGYARVVASKSPELDEGRLVSGLVPMGTDLTVRPAPSPVGFMDASPHRAELSPTYNRYVFVEGEGDDVQLIMRPLFGTALLLDMVLDEAGFDDVGTVVLTSASSKTAYSLGHLLRERPVETIGLTSGSRRAWVEGLGIYDAVLSYDDVGDLPTEDGAVLVDFAGDRALVRRAHQQLGDALERSILVGITHWQARGDDQPVPGPEPEFFFAPNEMASRGQELMSRFPAAWQGFASVAGRAMQIERVASGEELLAVYRELLAGRADPALGYVVGL